MSRTLLFLYIFVTPVLPQLAPRIRKQLLNAHNEFRQSVAAGWATDANGRRTPQAKAMIKLEWDFDLENSAQNWANRCPFARHDENRGDNIGENMAADSHNNEAILPDMVDRWFKEIKNAPVKDFNRLSRNEMHHRMGHFTQLIWAETTRVGCGFRTNCYYNMWSRNATFLVCRYNPSGNNYQEPIYITGRSCSGCSALGARCDSTYPALCTFERKRRLQSISPTRTQIKSTSGAIFERTETAPKRCETDQDCALMTVPRKWVCDWNKTIHKWSSKSCYCDTKLKHCIHERFSNGRRTFGYCENLLKCP